MTLWLVLGAATAANTALILWRFRHDPRRRGCHLCVISAVEMVTAVALWQHW